MVKMCYILGSKMQRRLPFFILDIEEGPEVQQSLYGAQVAFPTSVMHRCAAQIIGIIQ